MDPGCSPPLGSRHAWLHGWSMSSFLPFGIQDWLGSLPDAFQEPILSCLVGVGVGLISFKLRGIKLLSYSHKASEWQAWDSDPDGERNHTRDLMLWDRVDAEEEERLRKGKESKGLACHPLHGGLGPPLSCGHNPKQYIRKCSRIGTFERKTISQKSPTGILFYSRAKPITQ